MRIQLDDERRQLIVRSLQGLFANDFDRELSDYQAGLILEFFLRELGAPVYNQAIQDARRFFEEKLLDLEGEFFEPEEPV